MTNAFKCDRCGDYQDGVGAKWRGETTATPSDNFQFALCDSCADAFGEFMETKLTKSTGLDSIGVNGVRLEYTTEECYPPNHPVDTRCADTLSKLNKNLFGDADRAEGALDDQIKGGHRNY